MPQLTLQDALRYFFSPFLLYFYFAIYDESDAVRLINEFGATGALAFLVAGSVIYFVYRYLIFDYLISWIYDVTRKQTYRRFFQTKYVISKSGRWFPWHTQRARKLFLQISYLEERLQSPALRLRASGLHLLYQASLLALPFIFLTATESRLKLAIFFAGISITFFATAILQNMLHEDEDLAIIRDSPKNLAKAARLIGLVERST